MSEPGSLERTYRRWLRWYPRWFRAEHEDELLEVLLAGGSARSWSACAMDRLDLVRGGLGVRLRPRVPQSDRAAHLAVRLMLVGAVVDLGVAATIWATEGDVRASIVARDPRYTTLQWHAEVAGRLEPLAIGAVAFTVIWLWMAWANGRGRRWARFAFALLIAETTASLLHGLAQGSATNAPRDLAAGLVLWVVGLGAGVALARSDLRRRAAARAMERQRMN